MLDDCQSPADNMVDIEMKKIQETKGNMKQGKQKRAR
jgi:hypothetical protein